MAVNSWEKSLLGTKSHMEVPLQIPGLFGPGNEGRKESLQKVILWEGERER